MPMAIGRECFSNTKQMYGTPLLKLELFCAYCMKNTLLFLQFDMAMGTIILCTDDESGMPMELKVSFQNVSLSVSKNTPRILKHA